MQPPTERAIISFAEFQALPLAYQGGYSAEDHAHRAYRNDEHGLQVEIVTARKRNGEWHNGQRYYYLDGDEREYETAAACYNAYRWRRGKEPVEL